MAGDWPENSIVVNVQGDEPLIDPDLISKVAARLAKDREIAAATACSPISDWAEMKNPNSVKVVLDRNDHALYFSRAEIPFGRDAERIGPIPEGFPAYRHIGIYAYRAGFLRTYASLPHASIESIEALEQLRLLWNGYRIGVIRTNAQHAGVDTMEDLERIRNFFTEEKR